jgi:hypothetical protein
LGISFEIDEDNVSICECSSFVFELSTASLTISKVDLPNHVVVGNAPTAGLIA